ncbi:MAG: hypothetical protein ACHQ3P_01930 [Candidatus Limnocylindrales bacterium]
MDHVMLLVAATKGNRAALAGTAGVLRDVFPIGARTALQELADGRDPGGSGLVML